MVKNPPANAGDVRDGASIPGLGKMPWRRAWQPTPVFLPGESCGQRSLAGYSPRRCKELDMTETTEHTGHCSDKSGLWWLCLNLCFLFATQFLFLKEA